jgi:GH15 family glucan-1,4-alpha-glucosidase
VNPRIEDYALIGDMRTAALVSNRGSIDWLCLPRFDSPSCFSALLGDEGKSRFAIAPVDPKATVTRAYRDGSLVLDTTFTCQAGTVVLTDYMAIDQKHPRVMRSVRGVRGSVEMRAEYVVRFDYGSIVPWIRHVDDGVLAVAGPDALLLAADVTFVAEDFQHTASFTVGEGEEVAFELTYFVSYEESPPARLDGDPLGDTEKLWGDFSAACTYGGPYAETIRRSLVTLKALTYLPTGGIVAAPTTSLPEKIGGVRNWDYRYCWLRDATLTLYAFLGAGYKDAAQTWQRWLLRAVAGQADSLQIVYSIRGTRRIPELELDWLAGYEQSKPVRIGNDADGQFQLDVYGEVLGLLYASRKAGIEPGPSQWPLAKSLMQSVEKYWKTPDRGIWEVRGEPRHFVHSKVMAWVAVDRAVKSIEEFGYDGPLDRWRELRDEIHAEVLERGFDAERNTFVQSYGATDLDAATLLIPIVGFLPKDDPRVAGTIAAIERELLRDGFVMRYSQAGGDGPDTLPGGEGAFLACSFWLVDNYTLVGRRDDARELFERVLGVCNDVGLLAEEYDPQARRLVGNFPQAFSHVGLVNSAFNLWHESSPALDNSHSAQTAETAQAS